MRLSDELWQDLSSLRRHLWLPLIVLVVALAAAAGSLFFAPSSNEASFRHALFLSSLPPLFGPDTLPTMDDFARLALSDEALARTSETLRERGIDLSPDALRRGLSARARHNQNAIDFTATFDDDDTSLAVARAWSDVFAELAPARAPDLQREASSAYQRQLERARAELEEKRQQLAELGIVASADGESADPSRTAYEAKAAALAEKQVERAETENVINALRSPEAATLSAGQLRLLLGSLLPPEVALGEELTTQEALAALEMRAVALDATIQALTQEVQQLASAIDRSGAEVQQALTELAAAQENYEVAARLAQSYDVVGDLLQVTVVFLQEPHLEESGVLSYASRFAAAGAFALVAGVLGAFGLEQLQGRNRRPPTRRVSAATRLPGQPVDKEHVRLSARLTGRGRVRAGTNAYLQFGATALAVLLLVGILGTFLPRKTLRHRPRG